MASWAEARLGEISDKVGGILQTGPFGSQLHKADYQNEGVPVVMPKDIVNDRISTDSIARISESMAQKLERHRLLPGDIVYARRGDIGRRAFVELSQEGWLCGTGCLRISLGNTVVEPLFLFYYLGLPQVVEGIAKQAVGATMPNLNTGILRSITVEFPPLPAQRKIMEVLSAYDNLLENNTRRIKLLEQMAQLVYKEWFVDFRFPGHEDVTMVASELGPVPEGWLKNVEAVGKIEHTSIQPSKHEAELFEYYSFPAFDGGRMPEYTRGKEILSNKYLVSDDAVLFPKLNLRFARIWLPYLGGINQALASTEYIVLEPEANYSREFLYSLLKFSGVLERAQGTAGGTSTSHQRIKPSAFMEMPVAVPETHHVHEFERIVKSMFRHIYLLQEKNQNLRQTRDMLLPKLISGELDVSELAEAQERVGEAA